jgi:heat shock protein HslJ
MRPSGLRRRHSPSWRLRAPVRDRGTNLDCLRACRCRALGQDSERTGTHGRTGRRRPVAVWSGQPYRARFVASLMGRQRDCVGIGRGVRLAAVSSRLGLPSGVKPPPWLQVGLRRAADRLAWPVLCRGRGARLIVLTCWLLALGDAACAREKSTSSGAPLNIYVASNAVVDDHQIELDPAASFSFLGEGRVSFYTGCRTFAGPASIVKGILQEKLVESGPAVCTGTRAEQERILLQVVSLNRQASLSDDRLVLASDRTRVEFARVIDVSPKVAASSGRWRVSGLLQGSVVRGATQLDGFFDFAPGSLSIVSMCGTASARTVLEDDQMHLLDVEVSSTDCAGENRSLWAKLVSLLRRDLKIEGTNATLRLSNSGIGVDLRR